MFEKVKHFFNKSPTVSRMEMITERGNGFYAWNGSLYHSDLVRSCIRPKVKAIGKLTAKHVRQTGSDFQVNPEVYMRFLLEEPNPFMTGQMLQEKLATQLQLNNNAFAYIVRDPSEMPVAIYPIPVSTVEAVYNNTGDLFLRCFLLNGKMVTFPYVDVIHLRQDFNTNDVFGESPQQALAPLMEIVNTTDQGIVNAIKNSAVIKWLLKFNTTLRPEDIKQQTDDFTNTFLSIENTGGAAGTDAKMDAIQVTPHDFIPNALQMDKTTQRIFSFFGTNEKIIQSRYNEDEWNAYYEAEIEPFALQASGEFTRKLFSRKQRGFGNSIMFESSNLQYASMSTKLALYQVVDRGAMTPNEWRKILGNLTPVPGGDEAIRRLDTQPVGVSNLQNKIASGLKNKVLNIREKIYAVDFDGTLCKNIYPNIGYPIQEVIDYVKELKKSGNKVILYTCRVGDTLDSAVKWCSDKGIEFDAINENLQEVIEQFGSDTRKIYADYYVDDKAMNVSEIMTCSNE